MKYIEKEAVKSPFFVAGKTEFTVLRYVARFSRELYHVNFGIAGLNNIL